MFIHSVYFWLSEDLGGRDVLKFEEGLVSLTQDTAVESGYYGKPADTRREVVENSYTYGLVLIFEDAVGHDRYQSSAAHHRFLEKNRHKWRKIVVFDVER